MRNKSFKTSTSGHYPSIIDTRGPLVLTTEEKYVTPDGVRIVYSQHDGITHVFLLT